MIKRETQDFIRENTPIIFQSGFLEWLVENTTIWFEFRTRADALRAAGRKHFGARTIIEAIRYHTALIDNGSVFKINNAWAPDMARLYAHLHPESAGFFETRVTGNRRAA